MADEYNHCNIMCNSANKHSTLNSRRCVKIKLGVAAGWDRCSEDVNEAVRLRFSNSQKSCVRYHAHMAVTETLVVTLLAIYSQV